MLAGIFLNPATMSFPLRQNRHVALASASSPAQPLSRIAYGQLSRPMPMNTLICMIGTVLIASSRAE